METEQTESMIPNRNQKWYIEGCPNNHTLKFRSMKIAGKTQKEWG